MIWSSPEASPARRVTVDGSDAVPWDVREVRNDFFHALGGADPVELEELREQEREEAYRRGRADGEQAAHARARREVETALSAARRVVQQVREAQEGWDRLREENLVALATAVARHIVGRELTGDVESYRTLVRKATSTFPLDHALKIRVNPSDLAMLMEAGGGQAPPADAMVGREVRWIADEDVVAGGCLVEGPDRIVDGRVDEALHRIFWELTHG